MIRRESSEFLRLKQAQWEKEKAESEKRAEWFPFGENLKPGGGSPLRKFVSKEPSTSTITREDTPSTSMQNNPPPATSPNSRQKVEATDSDEMNKQNHIPPPPRPHTHHHPYSYPLYTFPYPITSAFNHPMIPPTLSGVNEEQEHGVPTQTSSMWHHQHNHQFFAPQYQVIPAGAIPVSTINIDPSQICPVDQMGMWAIPPPTGPNGMRYGIPIPAPLATSIMDASKTVSKSVVNAMTSSTSSNDSSSESGICGVKEAKEEKRRKQENREREQDDIRQEERQSTSDYTDDDPVPLTRRSITGSVTYDYAEQIAERRRFEQQQEAQERQELLEIERQKTILEDRRNSEEEARKKIERERIEEEQRRTDKFAAAMEKAKKEAELLKKAKLYKHVLRGAEEEGGDEQLGELEHKLLGVDLKTGQRLLKEVSEVEWHKKQDEVEMRKNSSHSDKSTSIASHTGRARSSSISSPMKNDSSFTRNSVSRRSLRTTSREKSSQKSVEISGNGIDQRPPSQPSAVPDSLPSQPQTLQNQYLGRSVDTRSTTIPSKPDMMLNGFYCPMNRDPLSQKEEYRSINKPSSVYHNNNNKSEGVRHNQITQSALFGPISTRTSIRRGVMRGLGPQSPATMRISPQKQSADQRSSSFEESSSGGEEGGSLSPDLVHKNFDSPLPSSTENVHPAPSSPPMKSMEEFEFKTPTRARSALGSPMGHFLNGANQEVLSSRPPSRLMQCLEQKGTIRREDEIISQEIRRVAETNLSRSPSLASLRGSIQNLSLRGSHLNLAGTSGELPPNLSKFASVNSPARQSLTSMKKTTDRQAAVLERLGRLRESLHAGKNYTPPRHGLPSSRITTPAQTPPISPRPVF